MFRFTIRELALLMAVVAVTLAWWIENRRAHTLHRERDSILRRLEIANELLQRVPQAQPRFSSRLSIEREILQAHLQLVRDQLRIERAKTSHPVNAAP